MTQKIQFRKLKIFSEEVTSDFPPENIHESLRLLLRGTEKKSTEYIDKYFEHIRVPYLQITVSQLEKVIPDFDKTVKYPLFDPRQTTFFMMDHQVWHGIQEITETLLKDAANQEKELDNKLNKIAGIAKNYDLLLELFTQKLLFANIF